MTDHAKLSASGSHRWLACPGSVKAEEGLPDRTSPQSEEGTKAHAIAEALLNGAPDVDVTGFEPVLEYVEYVTSLAKAKQLFVEKRVDFSEWVPDGFGTCDTIILDVISGDVDIVDLKYGKGLKIYADDNSQLKLYALGVVSNYGFILREITKITLHIVQPRLDHISTWSITLEDLLTWGERVKELAQLALSENAPRVPGDSQCQWCKAKPTCPALLKRTQEVTLSEFDRLDNPDTLTDPQLRYALENKKLIVSWLDAVESLVYERLQNGGSFEGFKLVTGRTLRDWANPNDAEIELSRLVGDAAYEKKLLSVAKAEKLLGKKKAQALEHLVAKTEGAPRLAQDSDRRKASGADASDFDF